MPPRLNKRQLREQEELAELEASRAAAAPLAESDDDEEEAALSTGRGGAKQELRSAFGALHLGEHEEDSDEDEEVTVVAKSKKPKNRKKKKAKGTTDSAIATPSSLPSTPSSKKSKAPGTDSPRVDPEMDEIDRALVELAAKAGPDAAAGGAASASQGPNTRLEPKWQAVKDVYAFDPKFLDADAELRRMFGSKVISATPNAPRSGHHARFANNPHHSTSIRRTASYLASPEPGWLPPGGVLSVTRYAGAESRSDAGEWWTYQHSRQYREAQLGFLEVLQQADGNRLYNVLEGHPYHIDTLMQLSEMMVQQGDLGASSTHLSKALYALSAPLPPSFPSGSFRLPYSQIENRAFFLGVARKVSILVKRGTWRTACEWSKIALGCGGGADPVGMLVFIDFLAPKAKQNTWFLSMLDALSTAYPDMRIESYPGLAYAKALSLRGLEEEASEDDTKSTAALRSAILRFPMVVPLLFASLGGNVPPKLLSHRRAQLEGSFTTQPSYLLELLSQLYVVRSSPLWKEPSILAWLQKTAAAVAPSLDESSLEDVRIGERLWAHGPWPAGVAPAGVIRAAYISEIASIRPYLPPSTLSGTSYSYDPLPPPSPATFYNDSYFAPLYSNGGSRHAGARDVRAQQAPDAGAAAMVRNQLAALLGFGNGEAQVELNPELREELMAELDAMTREARGDGPPGGFLGGEDSEGEYGDVEEGEEPTAQEAQNFLGRLAALMRGGGGGGAAQAEG